MDADDARTRAAVTLKFANTSNQYTSEGGGYVQLMARLNFPVISERR